MTTYTVRAKTWAHGWELHIAGVGVTQSRTLANADLMVRDYIATLYDLADASSLNIVITPELGGLEVLVSAAREHTRAVELEQQEAAKAVREVARSLRELGMSVTDTATILGVSRGRVSQLTKTG